jgi:hypothetical protein
MKPLLSYIMAHVKKMIVSDCVIAKSNFYIDHLQVFYVLLSIEVFTHTVEDIVIIE